MLEVFPLNQIADVGALRSKDPKLISREIIFEEFQPMWSRYLNGQTIYDRNTALCTKVHRAVKMSTEKHTICRMIKCIVVRQVQNVLYVHEKVSRL